MCIGQGDVGGPLARHVARVQGGDVVVEGPLPAHRLHEGALVQQPPGSCPCAGPQLSPSEACESAGAAFVGIRGILIPICLSEHVWISAEAGLELEAWLQVVLAVGQAGCLRRVGCTRQSPHAVSTLNSLLIVFTPQILDEIRSCH